MPTTLKKLLPLILFVAGVVVVIFGIGTFVPTEHLAQCRAVLRKPVPTVWETVSDLGKWPEWLSEFDSMSPRAGGAREVWDSTGEFGNLPITVERRLIDKELVTYMDAGDFNGRWYIWVKECPAGTELTITELGEVPGAFMRGMMFFMDEHASIKSFVGALGRRLEVRADPEEVHLTPAQFRDDLEEFERPS